MNKTRAPRFMVDGMRVIYDTGEEFWSARVVDMSESGLFVETSHELPVGTRVTIMPDAPEEEALPFEIHGVVARANEYDVERHWDRVPGLAFRLDGLTVENFDQLRNFLKAHGVPVKE